MTLRLRTPDENVHAPCSTTQLGSQDEHPLGEYSLDQSVMSFFATTRFARSWSSIWKSLTASHCSAPPRLLYIGTSPQIDLRISSDTLWPSSGSTKRRLPSRLLKNSRNCGGPLPMAARWRTPNKAISRRIDNGAKLKCNSASSLERPSSRRKES